VDRHPLGFAHLCRKILSRPAASQGARSFGYIQRNYISEIVIKHTGKAEATRVKNFPFDAIEEALVNAVYHRSYEEREPIEVRVYGDELVVLSYPGPDRSVQLDQSRRGRAMARRYRNRRIGEFLKELSLTEGRSTGIPKILRVMAANGSPPPEFEADDEHSSFLVRLPAHPQAGTAKVSVGETAATSGTKSAPSRHQVGTRSAPGLHSAQMPGRRGNC
jgi:ATP-dependent DNA helicase RecG